MKTAYPIILKPTAAGYFVTVPDFDINTFGSSIPDAICMAADVISLTGITLQDQGRSIPAASQSLPEVEHGFATFAVVDFDEYRRANDQRTVRKNVTLPSWLNYQAVKAGINFSKVLQDALLKELNSAH